MKRDKIIDMNRSGAFIPLCTKNVFLKYYTPSKENQIHHWQPEDQDSYLQKIRETLAEYLARG